MMPTDFAHTLSVGAVRLEDRFCTSKKVRIGGGRQVSAQEDAMRIAAALAACRTALVSTGPYFTLLAQMGAETTPFPLQRHHFWYCRHFLVTRSVHWSESPDH